MEHKSRYTPRGSRQEIDAAIALASRVTVLVYEVLNPLLSSDGLKPDANDHEIIKALAMAFYERMSRDS